MARQPRAEPPEKGWTPDSLRVAVRKLGRRLADVEAFNPQQVSRRYDPVVTGLETSISETLADVFGPNSRSYHNYQLAASLDSARHNANGVPHREVIEGLVRGRERAIQLLRGAISGLTEKLEDEFGESLEPDPRIARAGIAQAGAAMAGYGGPGSGYGVGGYGYGGPGPLPASGGGGIQGVQAQGVVGEVRVSIQNDTPAGGVIIAETTGEARFQELQARVGLLEASMAQLRRELDEAKGQPVGIGHNRGPDLAPVTTEELDDVDQFIALLKEQGPVPPLDPKPLIEQSQNATLVANKIKQYLDTFALEGFKSAGSEFGKLLVQAPFWIALGTSILSVSQALIVWIGHTAH